MKGGRDQRDQFFFYSTEYTKFWIDQRIIFIGIIKSEQKQKDNLV